MLIYVVEREVRTLDGWGRDIRSTSPMVASKDRKKLLKYIDDAPKSDGYADYSYSIVGIRVIE
jgi:hypothetical protein